MKTKVDAIVEELRGLGSARDREGQARFGIETSRSFGVRVPAMRALAKQLGTDHDLALALWDSGYHEARLLAGMVGDPARVTKKLMETWARDFDSWDIVDGTCSFFDKTPFAFEMAMRWCARKPEYVKRAGFAMAAMLAVHDKAAPDAAFEAFLPVIERESTDDRNFVRKAVNWALRQIGKRNLRLNRLAIARAERIRRIDSRAAHWIASGALRELRSAPVQAALTVKAAPSSRDGRTRSARSSRPTRTAARRR